MHLYEFDFLMQISIILIIISISIVTIHTFKFNSYFNMNEKSHMNPCISIFQKYNLSIHLKWKKFWVISLILRQFFLFYVSQGQSQSLPCIQFIDGVSCLYLWM